jgi:hypothetical protein
MKKILIATIMSLGMIGSAASANELIGGMHIGYSNISVGDASGHGMNLGYDFGIPVFTEDKNKGFNIGAEVEVQGAVMDETDEVSSSVGGGTVGLFVGYNYKKVYARVGGDYQYLSIADSTYVSGFVPNVRAGYQFTDKYGIEVSYKTGSLDLNGDGPGIDVDTIGISFTFHN